MQITLKSLTNNQIEEMKAEILEVYHRAFAEPPYNKTEADVVGFSQTLDLHRNRLNARLMVAQDENGLITGFAYGYEALGGQWWYEVVEKTMPASMAREWLHGSFELVELAVKPSMQGHGIGGRLHDGILSGLSNRTAVLSTIETETTALHLYRKRGWITLLENFRFPTSIHTYYIMGLKLPLKTSSSDSDHYRPY
jgi:ribosomal protein S18 acetylase RimI-like enzyme